MTTLIRLKISGAHAKVCNKYCYDAKHETCTCTCCGGKNHQKGLIQATKNTQEMAEELLKIEGVTIPETVLHQPTMKI